jgi:hypothetical protein
MRTIPLRHDSDDVKKTTLEFELFTKVERFFGLRRAHKVAL